MIPPFPYKPDLLLVIIITIALLRGSKSGLVTGFITGSLQDLFLGGFLGIVTIVKVVSGSLAGLIEGHLYKENYLMPPIIVFFFTLVHEGLTILISENLLFELNLVTALKNQILPQSITNGFITIVVYMILYKIYKLEAS